MDVEEFKQKYDQLKDNTMYKNFCSILDTKNQVLEKILKENQELINQLDNNKNKYKNRLNNQLAEGVEPDFEDFYLAEIEGKSNEYDQLIIKQKEFIEWLKNESIEPVRDAGYHRRICLDILEKYKEIIGKSINAHSEGGNNDNE